MGFWALRAVHGLCSNRASQRGVAPRSVKRGNGTVVNTKHCFRLSGHHAAARPYAEQDL